MILTEEIVDEIFMKCFLPYAEMIEKMPTYTEETAPDVVQIPVPLPNGINAVAFRSEVLKENLGIINELVDQIDWVSHNFEIPFLSFKRRIDGTEWTKNIYEMQKLYALATASDLIDLKKTNDGKTIRRINRSEAKVTLVSVDETGKIKELKKQ